jgi:glycosyltransferase involved in cell wall biosynthesis
VSAADGSLCGLVLPPHDPAVLAAALNRLLDDPAAYADAGAQAMRLARANPLPPSWAAIAR